MQHRTREHWLTALEEKGIPAGPINTVEEALQDPQAVYRGLVIERDDIPGIRSPMRFSDAPIGETGRCPGLGEHTDEILAELAALESSAPPSP